MQRTAVFHTLLLLLYSVVNDGKEFSMAFSLQPFDVGMSHMPSIDVQSSTVCFHGRNMSEPKTAGLAPSREDFSNKRTPAMIDNRLLMAPSLLCYQVIEHMRFEH